MKEVIENFVIEVLKDPKTKENPEMVAAISRLISEVTSYLEF
ncbi:hypothetical protein [Lactococcus lactis]|uniref:Uncharacterized protein n=1 Tax=Lactococcus lactis TaxID=1358 RepID=A0AAW5TMR9_9LACT|nr:hypothetical protein [Lactococcus lactis]MCW2280439.1 hypothetical protein [Lactococcus lactis]